MHLLFITYFFFYYHYSLIGNSFKLSHIYTNRWKSLLNRTTNIKYKTTIASLRAGNIACNNKNNNNYVVTNNYDLIEEEVNLSVHMQLNKIKNIDNNINSSSNNDSENIDEVVLYQYKSKLNNMTILATTGSKTKLEYFCKYIYKSNFSENLDYDYNEVIKRLLFYYFYY